MTNKSIKLILISFLFLSNISIGQISVFSNTLKADCNNWNSNNNWAEALKRPVTVSGLPVGGLSATGIQLREVRVRLGNSNCKGDLSSYQLRLTNPQGVQVLISNRLVSTTSSIWVDMKFRDDIALEKLREYPSLTVQASYFPHSIGYYAIENDGDFGKFLTAADPNGDWLFEIIENESNEVSFEKVELVFGPSLNVRDVTSCSVNNSCSGASCIYNGVFRGNNAPPTYKPIPESEYPGNTVNGCSWNGANNNPAYFSFRPTSTTAKITISGMLNNTLPKSADMQPIILKANGNCLKPNTVPPGGCPKDQTINNRSYSSDVTINPAPNTGGITTSSIYFNGISDNCEFNLSGLTVGDIYYLYVDGNGGQSSFFYIEIESGASTPCDVCCKPLDISGPTSVCSGASSVQYTQTGGTAAGTWSVNPTSAGTIDASGNFKPASGLTADLAAEIVFTDVDCIRRYDIIVTKCTTFGSFATATWLTTCKENSFFNTTGTGVDLIDRDFKDFNGRFLGVFSQNSNSLKFKGGEVKTFKNLTQSNVCGAKIYYRVYAEGATAGTFASLDLPFFENCDVPNSKFPSGGPCKDGDQKWQKIFSDNDAINLTTYPPGNYILQIYYDVSGNANSTSGCNPSDLLVVDNAGRYFSANFTIQATPVFTPSNPITCNGNDGSITISELAPSSLYALSYNKGTTPVPSADFTSDSEGKTIISGLSAGDYSGFSLTVNSCVINNVSTLNLTDPAPPTVNVSIPSVCAGSEATITAIPGIPGTYSYAWTTPSSVINPGDVSNFNSDVAGTYNVIITNTLTNCSSTSSSGTLTATPKTVPTFTQLGPFCKDAAITAILPAKSINNINGTWQPSAISSSAVGISPYTFKPDAGQCAEDATMNIEIKSLSFSVEAGNPISINAGSSAQANAQLTGISITDVASILWNPSTGLNADNVLDPIITPTIPNGTLTYSIIVKGNDGCEAKDDLTVNVLGECLDIKNAFTPNGDGINDRWMVYKNFYCLKNISVTVFNRYGSEVYRNSNYLNQWDGLYKGKPCPDGTYYAILEIELTSGKKYIQRTELTIVR